ncbi:MULTISPECIES: hypothetical protein [unclassified Microbacterium]|nr:MULTISPECIES: hypothetical protein [unclassified Microbacterium]
MMIHTSPAEAPFSRAAGMTSALGDVRNRTRLGAFQNSRTHTAG